MQIPQIKNHVVQSPEWAEFKSSYGTPMIKCGEIFYSKHKIPLTPYYVAYCPKVNPFSIDWELVKESLKKENCVSINFDIPNVAEQAAQAQEAINLFEKHCIKSARNVFAPYTVFIDISGTPDEILKNMHPKHRYNIKIAKARGVKVRLAESKEDYDLFYKMLDETAIREKYYVHSHEYYKKIWTILRPKNMCEIMIAEHEGAAMGAWMLFFHQNVLYYPYGASAETKDRNYYNPGNLIGWEAMAMGKQRGCTLFDMWGAAKNPDDKNDPWWGFTNFKLKFGGQHIGFILSYDLVINSPVYKAFILSNKIRWKILRLIR